MGRPPESSNCKPATGIKQNGARCFRHFRNAGLFTSGNLPGKHFMPFDRSSGLLLHITSLPSYGGIGDMGPAAYAFADFLAAAKQRHWQVLPLSPTGYGNSPY